MQCVPPLRPLFFCAARTTTLSLAPRFGHTWLLRCAYLCANIIISSHLYRDCCAKRASTSSVRPGGGCENGTARCAVSYELPPFCMARSRSNGRLHALNFPPARARKCKLQMQAGQTAGSNEGKYHVTRFIQNAVQSRGQPRWYSLPDRGSTLMRELVNECGIGAGAGAGAGVGMGAGGLGRKDGMRVAKARQCHGEERVRVVRPQQRSTF